MKLHWIILLLVDVVQSENRCNKIPRAPSPGCCPDAYRDVCCPVIPSCNLSKAIESTAAAPASQNSTRSILAASLRRKIVKFPCSPPWDSLACSRGFYNLNGSVEACPPGFYCPELSTCAFPCPVGAYCKQYRHEYEYKNPKMGGVQPLCKKMGMCCVSWHDEFDTPTEVILQNGSKVFKCPGMHSAAACPKGYYCPDPLTKLTCKIGHFCPQGTNEPLQCPLLTICNEGTSAPLNNLAGPLLAACIILSVVAIYQFYFRCAGRSCCLPCYHKECKEPTVAFARYSEDRVTIKQQREAGIQPKEFTIDITFNNLSLGLKSRDKKVVLSGVTGAVMSGEVTAVMGPSGAGKTTFLNALSGKAYYGKIGGEIMVNGEKVESLSKYRKVTGFVPQEDIMHRKLTVEEVLTFQGRLRLPGSTPANQIKSKVDEILKLLEIDHVARILVGDEETRGISGGQRKRVNIGMELIADPTLLFLDEPTSGLDSTSSLSVLTALRAVAEKGRLTVVCVIHQPRYEIFELFHKLLFLGSGGRTVYQGSVQEAKEYFDGMGRNCPSNTNPADYYMDVIGGIRKEGDDCVDLFDEWSVHANRRRDGNVCNVDILQAHAGNFKDRSMPNVFQQFIVFLKREVILQLRNIKSLLLDMFLVLLAGGVLGALYSEVSLEKIITMNTMSSLAIGLTAILASLRCFGNHRTIYWRESAVGINRFSYFLAVNVCQIPLIMIAPLAYLSLQYTFSWPRALFKYHYFAVLMAQFATTGIGYTISCIFNPINSQMAAVVIVLISSLLSGAIPSLCSLNEITVIGPIAYSLSYCRWFVEALFEKEVERYPAVMQREVDMFVFKNNYDLESYFLCLFVLLAFGIFFRIVSYLCLTLTNRGQQQ